jgi:hypothetical protein
VVLEKKNLLIRSKNELT